MVFMMMADKKMDQRERNLCMSSAFSLGFNPLVVPKMLEAMILSDASNLDDMGAIGIFSEFKRYIIGGKGVSNVLHTWKRKIDYKYWQARLKESFRFESVRKIAEQRLSTAEYFMNQLKVENTASDLEESSIDSAND